MKRRILAVVCIFFLAAALFSGCDNVNRADGTTQALIRIHIRANSNDAADQAVKMAVKAQVTAYLERELAGIDNFYAAKEGLAARLGDISTLASRTLTANGFSYGAKARLTEEFFPTRAYESVIVESGYYDALIIELGAGAGDNWWCVIYPPLCFLGSESGDKTVYHSKIKELWERFCAAASK